MIDRPLPAWWHPLAANAASLRAEQISRHAAPREGGRPSAVLILLGDGDGDGDGGDGDGDGGDGDGDGALGGDASRAEADVARARRAAAPELLLLERSHTLRNHAGQPAFPGGATDPGDDGPIGTALREAEEEVGLDPGSVQVVSVLPALWLPPSNFVVTPVLGWWHTPHPVHARATDEVARVECVPVADLVDPGNRLRVRHPSGYIGPAFAVRNMLVWGFTAGLISALLDLAGWSEPWDESRIHPLTPG